jgi:hypothetical protein
MLMRPAPRRTSTPPESPNAAVCAVPVCANWLPPDPVLGRVVGRFDDEFEVEVPADVDEVPVDVPPEAPPDDPPDVPEPS